MFSWGEDSQRGFKLKGGLFADSKADDGVGFLDLGCHVVDLSAGRDVLAFVKSNGNASIIRTNVSNDGRRVRGKQSERHMLFFFFFYKTTFTKLLLKHVIGSDV